MFVPGQAGVRVNERADSLAGFAAISEGKPLDHADTINDLGDIERVVVFDEHESSSILRLHELAIKTYRLQPNTQVSPKKILALLFLICVFSSLLHKSITVVNVIPFI